jgi:hypothetical protein
MENKLEKGRTFIRRRKGEDSRISDSANEEIKKDMGKRREMEEKEKIKSNLKKDIDGFLYKKRKGLFTEQEEKNLSDEDKKIIAKLREDIKGFQEKKYKSKL